MKKCPYFSIIFVNYNGKKFVNNTIASIYNSTFQDFELIIVDNASRDNSIDTIPKKFTSRANLKIIKLPKNIGPAGGLNKGAEYAHAPYLVIFGFDVVLKRDCLAQFARFTKDFPNFGALHGKILNMEQRELIDYAGDYLDPIGFLVERAKRRKDTGTLDYICPVLSSNSAIFLIKKEVFEEAGGFDDDYFFLLEETDLDWRVWLRGYPVLFVPQAVIYHASNTRLKDPKKHYTDYLIKHYGSRNYLQTLIKNLGLKKLIQIVPLHIASWLIMAFFFFVKGKPRSSYYIIKGLSWNFLNLPTVLRKRRYVQKNRRLSDAELAFLFIPAQGLKHYLGKIFSYIND